MKKKEILLGLVFLLFAGCGSFEVSDGEDHGNILNTALGLVLTQEEHAIGWGESNCFLCHQADNIHQINRTGLDSVNVATIQSTVLKEGLSSCDDCHGTNGVP